MGTITAILTVLDKIFMFIHDVFDTLFHPLALYFLFKIHQAIKEQTEFLEEDDEIDEIGKP